MMRRGTTIGVAALTALLAGTTAAQPWATATWHASSGSPEEACPPWTLDDTATGTPLPSRGTLQLAAAAPGEAMAYHQGLDTTADPLVVELRVRLLSSSAGGSNRGPIAVTVTSAADEGVLFFIDADEMYLVGAGNVVGDSATVDTSGAFHTYRLAITGDGAVSVDYDGTPMLAGQTFASATTFGARRRIVWGDTADAAFGSHAWESVAHNGAACGAATTTSTTGPSPTTTTAPPPAGCDDVQPGSLEALGCRLERLEDRIDEEDALGSYRAKLLATVGKAIDRGGDGVAACSGGDAKTARRRVKQLQRYLTKMAHRLRSLAARKRLSGEVRGDVIAIIDGIKADASTLRADPCASAL
jgi:hypothetical protein